MFKDECYNTGPVYTREICGFYLDFILIKNISSVAKGMAHTQLSQLVYT